MTQPFISCVIPTTGRATLERTLQSIRNGAPYSQIADIEIIVVGDTHLGTYLPDLSEARRLCEAYAAKYMEYDGGSHAWGNAQRDYGMRQATGRWISFSQDDDIYAPGAFTAIRNAVTTSLHGDVPMLFQCYLHHGKRAVWEQRYVIESGNVDANCIVVPNDQSKLGTWTHEYQGDLAFIVDTVERYGGNVRWCETIIAEARPA